MKSVLALSLIHGGREDSSICLASTSFLHTAEESEEMCAEHKGLILLHFFQTQFSVSLTI